MGNESILITGTGSLIGQAIIKSIKRSTLKDRMTVIGCDYFESTVGSYWCDKNYLLPDLLKADQVSAWRRRIYEIIEKEDIKALFIGVDFELGYLSDMKDDIEDNYGCKVIVSDRKVIDIGNDKYKTYQFLEDNRLNAPKTALMDEIKEEDLKFPIVIKPRVGARSRGVSLIGDIESYRELSKECIGKGYIVQEAVGSMDTEYTCGILYWDGEYRDSIILKRILKAGNTATAEFNGNKETKIKDYIRSIGDVLVPFGSCNLQLRVGNDGNPYLFEINPRFSGTTYMRALLGYNEVEYIITCAMGWETPVMTPISGKVYRYYEETLVGNR